ncbi:MAG: Na(+)-translocating NADH-quinone reductase subunit C [Acidobacteriota bacterium]
MHRSVSYNLGFATLVCVVCAVVVSTSAVSLRERQEFNAALEKQRNVLVTAGLAGEDESLTRQEIQERFSPIRQVVIDLATGDEVPDIDPRSFDQRKEAGDPATSRPAPDNPARVERLPNHALVYQLVGEDGELRLLILPVEGKGLWSTLYGFLALDPDLETVRGITFYEHKETPGLGGEVDNPKWKALWAGRKVFDEDFHPRITVIKGRAGPPEEDPYRVDGLSGATMTSRGVTNLVRFWLGEDGFGTYLRKLRQSMGVA